MSALLPAWNSYASNRENETILAIPKANLFTNVSEEKKSPEISTPKVDLWLSTKSDWIDGGIDRSAPRQIPVRIDTIIKKFISPSPRKKTKEKLFDYK